MLSQIKHIHTPDFPSFEQAVPDNPLSCSVLLQLMVGPKDMPGEESFALTVSTPQYFIDHPGVLPQLCRATMLIEEWNLGVIDRLLKRTFDNVAGDTWEEIASKLGRFALHEFEDYRQ